MTLQQTPEIQARPDVPYVGVTCTVTMATIAEAADRLLEVLAWLAERGVEPAGPPFFRYRVIDMEDDLVLDVGFPVATPVPDDAAPVGHVVAPGPRSGTLPAGRYVVVGHHGHPDELEAVTGDLLAWAATQGLAWDADDQQRAWGARVERYLTDPSEQPDLAEWDHELAFRLAD
ncbi:GyrI-like domain-containing protein [Cellulosimicrobium sp. PMB13]|uniref:GyrI-like domain-containing protein n=1 Tax=Cellulosimicrobium sp. PMB13 TaxID=3120158 RepID=UPI003F4BF126